ERRIALLRRKRQLLSRQEFCFHPQTSKDNFIDLALLLTHPRLRNFKLVQQSFYLKQARNVIFRQQKIKLFQSLRNGSFNRFSLWHCGPSVDKTFKRVLFKLVPIDQFDIILTLTHLRRSAETLRLVHGSAVGGYLGVGGTQ